MKQGVKTSLVVGITLFSMFFGAGNLIFPPYLGAQSGTLLAPAFVGLALSAIGLPVLGVLAVALNGGLPNLAGKVGAKFRPIFTVIIYLAIGPCLAIPRTASTSFSMAAVPFLGDSLLLRVVYSAIFFGIALAVAFHPEKISSVLGRITGPLLLILIFAIVAACFMNPPGQAGAAQGAYAVSPLPEGFIYGYQTMDAIAALVYGIVIAQNIRSRGIQENKKVVCYTIQAGFVAGFFLLLVYLSLANIGAMGGPLFPEAQDGTAVLTGLAFLQFGSVGAGILGSVFFIACLNTAIGLLSSCGTYFHTLHPKWSVQKWVVIFTVASFLISIAGLDAILKVSVPVLGMIYPMAIVLILLGVGKKWFVHLPKCYVWSVALAGIVGVITELGIGSSILEQYLPFYSIGLGWVLPAAVGLLAGVVEGKVHPQQGRI
ncbi:MAG TPA: branched-chain amino acid transport system II carrier protein [Firmicutes bacterium]|nr:branched-chain amino acid transport system II carrier protein [Bacillota bacterium]